MATIERVEVAVARVPLADPVRFSNRVVEAREYCLVRVTGDNGEAGLGYSYAVNNSGRLLAGAILEAIGPLLLGADSLATEELWHRIYQQVLLIGRTGAVMRALSAADIALWDLNAKSAGLPLYKYLGAAKPGRVPAYGSGGYYLPGKTINDLCAEMRGFVDAGCSAVKMKIGGLPPSQDEDRVRAVRDAIGPDVHLMLDANNAWPDLPSALVALRKLEKYSPYWIEEPFLPDDIESHAALARATPMLVATGEVEAGRWRFKEILDKKAAAILQADAIVCGGVSEWRRIAATASSYGVPVAPHAWHDVHAHLVASATNASFVEFMPDSTIVNFRDIIDHQMELEAGDLVISDRPGLGFGFDPEKIDRFGLPLDKNGPWISVET